MKLKISHRTLYEYSNLVFAEPHHLYFYPSQRNYFKLKDFRIHVDPAPSGLAFRLDAENNPFHQCWFNFQIEKLEISIEMEVETSALNPFDFLVEEDPHKDHQTALQLYLGKVDLNPKLVAWITEIRELSGGNMVTFLSYLVKEINADWEHNERYAENVLPPNLCFEQRSGSCRDLSWMMIQMLRQLNIPARFVSGYAFNPGLKEGHELHAWVEAWVPGGGWIGLDPSAGLLAMENYIPACSSYKPENTLPVQGSYRGDSMANLTFEVRIEEI